MKGTIDVQIKRKDGSIETRHEHNVVFDIPVLILKEFTDQPLRLLGSGIPAFRISRAINWFNMSTELADLTFPRWFPNTLITTGSASSVWHTAPITRIVESKKITMSASWTIGEPLTIRSISVPGTTVTNSGNFGLYVDKYGVLCDKTAGPGRFRQRVLSPSDYSFTNGSFSDMYPGNKSGDTYYQTLTSATGQPMYIEYYPLANPDERFIYYKPSTGNVYLSPDQSGDFGYANPVDIGIRIIDPATRTTLREFPLSQFDKANSGYYVFVVVCSGTKNWLLRSYSYKDNSTGTEVTKYKTRIWQIPDAATTETIPCFSEDFGAGVISGPISYRVDEVCYNYLRIALSDETYANETWCKITDDGTLIALPGSAKNVKRSNEYIRRQYSDNRLSTGWYGGQSSPSSQSSAFVGAAYYPKLTSANFSTPIELAEGDVLTVSYKIEVA